MSSNRLLDEAECFDNQELSTSYANFGSNVPNFKLILQGTLDNDFCMGGCILLDNYVNRLV